MPPRVLRPVPLIRNPGEHSKKQRKQDVVALYNALRTDDRYKSITTGGGSPSHHEHVARILMLSRCTVSNILKEAKDTEGEFYADDFRRDSISLSESDELGLYTAIRKWVLRRNSEGDPPTSTGAVVVVNNLLVEAGHSKVSARTVRRWLRDAWGFKYARGVGKYVLRESPAVREYRDGTFLPRLIDDVLDSDGDGGYELKRGESIVCVDESYVQPGHTRHWGWLFYAEDRKKSVQSGLVIILAAIYIRRVGDGSYDCGVLPNTIQVWNAASTGFKRGKRSATSIKDDYHGAMNADMFEKWFTVVCKEAKTKCGDGCHVLLDNSKNHLRMSNGPPPSNSKKADMIAWLQKHKIRIPTSTRASGPKRQQLKDVIKANKARVVTYRTWDIARKNGKHKILKTPPYHPEFQPIERVWAVIKNKFADTPKTPVERKSIPWTISTIVNLFDFVTPKTILGAWNKSLEAVAFFDTYEDDFCEDSEDEPDVMDVDSASDSDDIDE